MTSFDTIIVPIDFSETSLDALRLARALKRPNTTLHLLHVIPDPDRQPWLSDAPSSSFVTMEEEWRQDAFARLRKAAADCGLEPASVTYAVPAGPPAQTILAYADASRPGLIVMGARGDSAVERFFFGSVADRVVRHSRWPVLTVPRDSRPQQGSLLSLRRILVPTDFSENAREALLVAADIARRADGELHLLHVIPDALQVPWLAQHPGIEYYLTMERAWKARAEEELERLIAETGLPAERVVTAVDMGHPAALIMAYADAHEANLIVMGAHGHGAVERFFLGSIADRTVHHATRPVLTVPSQASARTEPAAAEAAAEPKTAPAQVTTRG